MGIEILLVEMVLRLRKQQILLLLTHGPPRRTAAALARTRKKTTIGEGSHPWAPQLLVLPRLFVDPPLHLLTDGELAKVHAIGIRLDDDGSIGMCWDMSRRQFAVD